MTTVAIVSVSYRSAQLMINCIRSVEKERGQSPLSIRAIVVDNASGDFPALEQAVRENGWSSWVTLLLAPRNGGFAYGNNLGIRVALEGGADYILLLNPDTEVRHGAIDTLVSFLEAHPQAGIAGSSFEQLDGTYWPFAFRFPTMVSEFCSALSIGLVTRLLGRWTVAREMPPIAQPVDWICGAAMMIRPQVFQAIGGLDENYFLYFEETDFCFRALTAGFETWYAPQSRVMHVIGQSTKVTEIRSKPKPLPDYWFESRRRYFARTCGTGHAMLIDLIILAVYPIGFLKHHLLLQRDRPVPRYLRDFWRHSILWKRNREVPPVRTGLTCEPAASIGC